LNDSRPLNDEEEPMKKQTSSDGQ